MVKPFNGFIHTVLYMFSLCNEVSLLTHDTWSTSWDTSASLSPAQWGRCVLIASNDRLQLEQVHLLRHVPRQAQFSLRNLDEVLEDTDGCSEAGRQIQKLFVMAMRSVCQWPTGGRFWNLPMNSTPDAFLARDGSKYLKKRPKQRRNWALGLKQSTSVLSRAMTQSNALPKVQPRRSTSTRRR